VQARCVVNATGVWSDDVRALDEGAHPRSIRPAKGVHVSVPWAKVGNDIAAIVPAPDDGRTVFVVPWGDVTYIGTTDTAADGPLDDPVCTAADQAYLLAAVNGVVRDPLTPADVVGTWAGLRPLLRGARRARTADLSRRHAVRVSPGGMVTVTGGKLTTYRRMAADAVDAAIRAHGLTAGGSTTRHLRLVGAEGFPAPTATIEPSVPDHLTGRYGSDAAVVSALAVADPVLGGPLVPGLPYLKAEAVFAVREEMARNVADVLERRTRARLLARDASAEVADDVAALLAAELGWSRGRVDAEAASYRASVRAEREQLAR
jgi:glycerol-3-phosphate dehydrogenase